MLFLVTELNLAQCGARLRYLLLQIPEESLAVGRADSAVRQQKVDHKIAATNRSWQPCKDESSQEAETKSTDAYLSVPCRYHRLAAAQLGPDMAAFAWLRVLSLLRVTRSAEGFTARHARDITAARLLH